MITENPIGRFISELVGIPCRTVHIKCHACRFLPRLVGISFRQLITFVPEQNVS